MRESISDLRSGERAQMLSEPIRVLVYVVVAVAAINWGLTVFDVNLVEMVLPTEYVDGAYLVVGLLGLVDLVDTLGEGTVLDGRGR